MPRPVDAPKSLKPYLFHGVELSWSNGAKEALGDCPFCGKEGKFSVNLETGLWRCWSCSEGTERGGGNVVTFLQILWVRSNEQTSNSDYDLLAKHRKLLYPETLIHWGVCRSIITNEWLVPAYGTRGKLNQLYRYSENRNTGKRLLLATSGVHHGLFGVPLNHNHRKLTYLCEGPWDAMALWEILRSTKAMSDGTFVLTGSEQNSLLADANVLGAPGCKVFEPTWASLFEGKKVVLMYDSDHPKVNPKTREPIPPGGYEGAKRVARILASHETPPEEIHLLRWGEQGHDPNQPSGYDVRDALSSGGDTPADRISPLAALLAKIVPIPEDWLKGRSVDTVRRGGVSIEPLPCESWKVLVTAWRKALVWTPGLDRALSVMLSCAISTNCEGDQLWCKIIGPAACGKSTLCEALSIDRRHVVAKSIIRGFHSGFRSKEEDEDNSLIAQLYGKTLVTKDGDTLLQAPNRNQILAEARDLYDGTSRSHYRNRVSRDYHNLRVTWILCGTSSLRQLDQSELGERFLDCVVMDGIDDDTEDDILLRVAHRSNRNTKIRKAERDEDLLLAMRLTGGYVRYLCDNAEELLAGIQTPEPMINRCVRLGKFVSYMRARPSTKQDESAERELGARLVSQYVRLANCLAAVLNRKSVDEEVMSRVRAVALDTARGRVLDLAKWLYRHHAQGAEVRSLVVWTGEVDERVKGLLRFLRRIGAAEYFTKSISKGVTGRPRWRLTKRLYDLYAEIMDED